MLLEYMLSVGEMVLPPARVKTAMIRPARATSSNAPVERRQSVVGLLPFAALC